MAINFPGSPTNGQVYIDTATGNKYTYNSAYSYWSFTPSVTRELYVMDDIDSMFNGYRKEFPIKYNLGTTYSPDSPLRITAYLGGVHVAPSKYNVDYVFFPDIPAFNTGFIVQGSNIVFATAPQQNMSFFGTIDTSTADYPTFRYNPTSTFKPLSIMIGTE